MIATINPSSLKGSYSAPASKSAMQRACALALLNRGQTIIQNPGKSNDDLAAIAIIKTLGAEVSYQNGDLIISSNGQIKAGGEIDCGESGLSFRMFAPIAALSNNLVQLNGKGSLLKRPMHFFEEIFPSLGVAVVSNNGFLPVSITGPLIPKNITIDASFSSQYLTGLLFSFAASACKNIVITVTDLKSKPYIDLSLEMLRHFKLSVTHNSYTDFYIQPFVSEERNIIYSTEADWSSASFLLVGAAIAGNICFKGLNLNSSQADKSIIQVLKDCKAAVEISKDEIRVNNTNPLQSFKFDATNCPDLFPPLAALAAYCDGVSVIKGISRLAGKESNRAKTLVEVFTKMGISIILEEDNMIITGGKLQATTVSSYHDHRIAMACAVAALKAQGEIIITDAEAVNKSYPAFYDHLKMLGAMVSLST